MKIRLSELRRLIREDLLLNESLKKSKSADEAPEDALLGRIAFGEERIDDVPPEPNTKFEKKMLQSLDSYIGNHLEMKFSSKEIGAIQDILASGMYKKIFRSPSGNIYRGMALPREQFEERFPELAEEVYADVENSYSKVHEITGALESNRDDQVSSWSSIERVARTFALESEFKIDKEAEPVMLIYIAKASDNGGRLFDLTNLYSFVKTANSSLRENESETLGFGPITYSSIKVERRGSRKPTMKSRIKSLKKFMSTLK